MYGFPYGRPQNVSPLIRGLRWGLLIAGIFYGIAKQQVYSALEARHRASEKIKQVARDKQAAIDRAKRLEEERKMFEF